MSKPEFLRHPPIRRDCPYHKHYSQALCIGDRIEISGQGGRDRFNIPDYFIKRAGKTIIDAANEGLRQRVLRGKASDALLTRVNRWLG